MFYVCSKEMPMPTTVHTHEVPDLGLLLLLAVREVDALREGKPTSRDFIRQLTKRLDEEISMGVRFLTPSELTVYTGALQQTNEYSPHSFEEFAEQLKPILSALEATSVIEPAESSTVGID